MNEINKIYATARDCNGEFSELKVKNFEDVVIHAKIKKVSQLSFFDRMKMFINNIFSEKKFVEIKVNDDLLLFRVQDIADSLRISPQRILHAEAKGSLGTLINLAVEAKHYHINYSTLEKYSKESTIEEFRYLAYLAESLHIPVSELIEAKVNGSLKLVLKKAQEVEEKCQNVFKKLDSLYEEVEGALFTKATSEESERIITNMTTEELRVIKAVVRSAFKALSKNPITGNEPVREVIVPITDKHFALARSSGESLEIIGLFGKLLGKGGFGIAVQRLNILEGKWESGNEAVAKIPQVSDEDSAQILQEAGILDHVHAEGEVLGVQKRLRVIKDVFKGQARHCHMGPLYQKDLADVLFSPAKSQNLSLIDKFSISYQFLHAVAYLHKKRLTHGDIKPHNIFGGFNLKRVYLSDFGGVIDHKAKDVPLQLINTKEYHVKQDEDASLRAHSFENWDLYFEIEKKADVFSTCSVLCSIFTNEMPYEGVPGSKDGYQLKESLKEQLISSGLSEDTTNMLIKGLSSNYQERPDAVDIFQLIKKDLNDVSPDLAQEFEKLSLI